MTVYPAPAPASAAETSSHEAPLLLLVVDEEEHEYYSNINETAEATGNSNMVDYKGRKAKKSKTGGWRSASFIMVVAMAEKIAFCGISSNLITYLTGPLGQSTATASENVNAWVGIASMLPLVGAFVADAYLGRYRTILFSLLLYILGLGVLTMSVALTSWSQRSCEQTESNNSCHSSPFLLFLFFSSLYALAIAQGGHLPCSQAFGADQFDSQDPEECKSRSSFFNWYDFSVCVGLGISFLTLFYIQENLSWVLGFGISCIAVLLSFLAFLLGTTTYRYPMKESDKSSIKTIAQVFIRATRNWKSPSPLSLGVQEEETETEASPSSISTTTTHQFKFLEKAMVSNKSNNQEGSMQDEKAICSMSDVNEAKGILKLVPIWCSCLPYAIVVAQTSTLFTKQGSTMDRHIGPNFQIPAASLQAFHSLSVILVVPIYDRLFVPIARVITGLPSGITMLQRIGCGMFITVIAMAVAAEIEKKRLITALNYGFLGDGGTIVPLSIWWLIPQYFMRGVSDVFIFIGLNEFFYDQVPNGLKSLGIGFLWSILGIGSFLSGILISILEKVTSVDGQDSWFSDNLNRGHLDYFYWLLVGLTMAGLITYIYFAKSYIYNRWN